MVFSLGVLCRGECSGAGGGGGGAAVRRRYWADLPGAGAGAGLPGRRAAALLLRRPGPCRGRPPLRSRPRLRQHPPPPLPRAARCGSAKLSQSIDPAPVRLACPLPSSFQVPLASLSMFTPASASQDFGGGLLSWAGWHVVYSGCPRCDMQRLKVTCRLQEMVYLFLLGQRRQRAAQARRRSWR